MQKNIFYYSQLVDLALSALSTQWIYLISWIINTNLASVPYVLTDMQQKHGTYFSISQISSLLLSISPCCCCLRQLLPGLELHGNGTILSALLCLAVSVYYDVSNSYVWCTISSFTIFFWLVVFYFVTVPQSVYPFFCQWTFEVLPGWIIVS